MRVLMLSWEFPPQIIGGLGRHVYELSQRLGNYGVETYVLTPLVDGCATYEEFQGVKVFRVGTPLTGSKRFKSWIFDFNTELIREGIRLDYQEKGFHLVHAHDWLVGYAGRSLSRVLNVPLVSTIHATEYGRNLGLHNPMQREIHDIERNLILDSECIVCCSNYMRNEIQSLFNPNPSRITVIPNGASMNRYRVTDFPPDQEFEGIARGEPVVFYIGRLVPEKGVSILIRAFRLVLQSIPSAKLVIAGRGPQGPELQRLAAELGLGDRVWFAGYISDDLRDRIYRRANVAVFPSLYEPFGIVALEAMASGTPVVVSDVGGLAEIVVDGETGLKVNPLNEANLASALIRVLSDPRLANRLRSQALKVITEKYNWDKIGAKTSQVYHAVTSRARKDGVG
ncbi:MAG: glycosyltransferase family 4 protein [Syntrophomonadaceae bacterium]|nr:glycosyltransferase family 4 protein [Syntrophomonadaceae bacterium]